MRSPTILSDLSFNYWPAGMETFNLGHDFSYFWIAGRMVLEGTNPYDPLLYTQRLHAEVSTNLSLPGGVFPYPPWALLFFLPFAYFPISAAYYLWLLSQLFCLGWVLKRLHREINPRLPGELLLLLCLLFPPVVSSFMMGQCTFHILALLLISWDLWRARCDLWCGLALAAVQIKPHSTAFILLFFTIKAVIHQRWLLLVGAASGMAILMISIAVLDPNIYHNFVKGLPTVYQSHTTIKSMSLSYLLVTATQFEPLKYIILASGLIVVLFFSFDRSPSSRSFYAVIIATIGSAPYLWCSTYLLLLPIWAHGAARMAQLNYRCTMLIIGTMFLYSMGYSAELPQYRDPPVTIHYLLIIFFFIKFQDLFEDSPRSSSPIIT